MAFSMPYKNLLSLSILANLIVGEPKDIEVVETKPIPAAPPTIEESNSSAVYDLLSKL